MLANQLEKLVKICIENVFSLCIGGFPGCGKTSIPTAVSKAMGSRVVVTNFATSDTTRSSGIPWLSADSTYAEFKRYGDLQSILTADPDERITWLWEEVGTGSHSVQASFRPYLIERGLNGKFLGPNVTIIGTTNDRTHKAASNGIIEPVKTGFHSLVTLEVDLKDSQIWAGKNGMHPDITFFWSLRPDLLNSEEVGLDFAVNPNPRGWEHASKFIWAFEAAGIPDTDPVVLATLSGCVGQMSALLFLDFRRNKEAVLSLDKIIADPEAVKIPQDIGQLYAICAGLARRVDKKTWVPIGRFAELMCLAGWSDHGVLLVKDAVRRQPDLEETVTYIGLTAGSVMGPSLQNSIN